MPRALRRVFIYLFSPYFVPAMKGSEAVLLVSGTVAAIVFAALGALVDVHPRRRSA